MGWTADLSNDPNNGYALCVDLWEGEEHRGRIERGPAGELALCMYSECVVPAVWLAKLLLQAEHDLTGAK